LYLRHKSDTTISPIHLLLQWKLLWTEYAKNNNVQSYRVWRNGLQPVIIKVEKNHLWFSGFQNEITKLFNLKTGLEWQLQLWPFDHNIGKVKQVHLHTHTQKKKSDSHVHNLFLHSISVIATLCLAAVVGALLHTKPASARIYSPIFSPAFQHSLFHTTVSKCWLPPVTQALHFLKILLDTLELVLKYWHFLATRLLSSCKECRLCMILGFLHSINEVFALMGCYTALTGISSVTTNQCCITSQKSEALKNVRTVHIKTLQCPPQIIITQIKIQK